MRHFIFGSTLQGVLPSVFGVVTLVLGVIMVAIFPSSANLADGFITPIIAFEFAKTPSDVLFLTGFEAQSIANREMMDAGHQWDMLFPFAYAGFIASYLVVFARQLTLLWLAVVCTVLIIPFDINENLTLLAITSTLENDADIMALLTNLSLDTWLKWWALAIGLFGVCIGMWQRKHKVTSLAAAAAAGSIAMYWWFSDIAVLAEIMSLLVFLFFLWLFIFTAYSLVKTMKATA